jgi:hypothetical protein
MFILTNKLNKATRAKNDDYSFPDVKILTCADMPKETRKSRKCGKEGQISFPEVNFCHRSGKKESLVVSSLPNGVQKKGSVPYRSKTVKFICPHYTNALKPVTDV